MRRVVLALMFVLLSVVLAQAQTAADYRERNDFTSDAGFQSRVQYAFNKASVDALQENETTTNHTARARLASMILKGIVTVKQLGAILVVLPSLTIQKDAPDGVVYTTITDANLQTVVNAVFSALATSATW